MPIYEYHCECNAEREVLLPFSESDTIQVCDCGETMQRKVPTVSFTLKQYGRQMALDSLNSGVTGGKRKAWAEAHSAQGL